MIRDRFRIFFKKLKVDLNSGLLKSVHAEIPSLVSRLNLNFESSDFDVRCHMLDVGCRVGEINFYLVVGRLNQAR